MAETPTKAREGTAPVARCGGLTKHGLPCSITQDLDASGFCKYHVPGAARCRGIARSTGVRCQIRWDLNADGFCRYHETHKPRQGRRCVAVAWSTGEQCKHTVGIDEHGLCPSHRPRNKAPSSICRGSLLGSTSPCKNEAKPGYAYCCAAHDPSMKYYAPSLFGDSRLRREVERRVVARHKGRDLYHHDALDLSTVGFLELDHIMEKQCFSYAFQRVDFRDEQEDVAFLAGMLREEVVNELPNLCLTRATTNRIKGAAVWHFLDDCVTGHVGYRGAATFTDYMLAEKRDGMRVGRETTRAISSEMGAALKYCQRGLAAQGETPLLESLSEELQRLYVQLQLHGSSRVTTKPGGRSKFQVAEAKSADSKDSPPPSPRASDAQTHRSQAAAGLNVAAEPFAPHKLAGASTRSEKVSLRPSRQPSVVKGAANVTEEVATEPKKPLPAEPQISPPSETRRTEDLDKVEGS